MQHLLLQVGSGARLRLYQQGFSLIAGRICFCAQRCQCYACIVDSTTKKRYCAGVLLFVLGSHSVFVPGPAGGLSTVLPPSWLRLFSPSELNQLISGGLDTGVDVDDMARWGTCCGHNSGLLHSDEIIG